MGGVSSVSSDYVYLFPSVNPRLSETIRIWRWEPHRSNLSLCGRRRKETWMKLVCGQTTRWSNICQGHMASRKTISPKVFVPWCSCIASPNLVQAHAFGTPWHKRKANLCETSLARPSPAWLPLAPRSCRWPVIPLLFCIYSLTFGGKNRWTPQENSGHPVTDPNLRVPHLAHCAKFHLLHQVSLSQCVIQRLWFDGGGLSCQTMVIQSGYASINVIWVWGKT